MKTKGLRVAAAAAGLSMLLILSATPANAQGSFSIKIVPWGCTEGDFAGASTRQNGQAYAYAYNTNRICLPNSSFDMRVTVSAGGSTSPAAAYWGDPLYHQIGVYLNKAGTPTGWHYYRGATNSSGTWQRNT